MNNQEVWEKEYQEFNLLSGIDNDRPNANLTRFLGWLKKRKIGFSDWQILDLGSGVGRNADYLANLGCKVVGLEFSREAVKIAKARATTSDVAIDYRQHDIGSTYPFPDSSFDLILDITSSNSLDEKGREVYLEEVKRVLKPGGWFFVRALCKDGDKNAKNLLKQFPGREKDTYVMPEMGLVERVFSREDFVALYSRYFQIEYLGKTIRYPSLNGRKFKRFYWVAYMQNV
jgi:SAM-dependent methyltransferase